MQLSVLLHIMTRDIEMFWNETAAGVLDGLLEHDNNNLTSADALLRMVPPIERALGAYRDRAVAAKSTPLQVVMLEAAVQGW